MYKILEIWIKLCKKDAGNLAVIVYKKKMLVIWLKFIIKDTGNLV